MKKFNSKTKNGAKTPMTSKQLKQAVAVLMLLIVLLVVSGVKLLHDKDVQSAEKQQAMQSQINNAMRTVYTAAVPIAQGQQITKEMLVAVTKLVDEDPNLLFAADDVGKIASVGIAQGQSVMKNMVAEWTGTGLYERECSFVWLSTNLVENDYVDVRILFPNGEDYVVVAKKAIKEPELSINNVFLWLSEDEILKLDAAVVDANLNGAKLYTTRYVRPELQSASVVTYQPNTSVQTVIASDPNIVDESKREVSATARRAMEERLALFEEANPGFILDDTTVIWEKKQSELNETIEAAGGTSTTDSTIAGNVDGVVYGDTTIGNENLTSGTLDVEGTADTTEGEIEYVD